MNLGLSFPLYMVLWIEPRTPGLPRKHLYSPSYLAGLTAILEASPCPSTVMYIPVRHVISTLLTPAISVSLPLVTPSTPAPLCQTALWVQGRSHEQDMQGPFAHSKFASLRKKDTRPRKHQSAKGTR